MSVHPRRLRALRCPRGEARPTRRAHCRARLGVDLPAYDLQGLADAFGLACEKVSDVSDLPALLRVALERDRATLIEVR